MIKLLYYASNFFLDKIKKAILLKVSNNRIENYILYQISRRGTKEIENILKKFYYSFNFEKISPEESEDFFKLLEQNDLDIFMWINYPENVPESLKKNSILKKLIHFNFYDKQQ